MFVGQLDGADQRFALAETVTIGPAGDEQMKFVGHFQITFGSDGRVLRMKTFNAIQARFDQNRNHVIGAVQPGMRHDGESAGLMNEFDGFERGHFGFGHPRRPVLFQETFEGFVQAAHQPGLHERPGDVRPAGRFAVGQRKNRFNLQRHVQTVDECDHFMNPILSNGLKLGDFRQ